MSGETFIHELPVVLVADDLRRLEGRFEVARQAYNALLHEGLRRLQLMRESRRYQAALELPSGKMRRRRMNEVRKDFGLREYDLCQWGTLKIKRSWMSVHLDREALRALGTRAYRAVWHYHRGVWGRPRFKGRNQLDSIEGQSNRRGLHFHRGRLKWFGLEFRVRIDQEDPHTPHALSSRIKHIRLVRRRLCGRTRFFMQLVCEGRPYVDPGRRLGRGLIAIDPGPRVFAFVSEGWGNRVDLATQLGEPHRRVKRIQRSIERKRRLLNPENYQANGQVRRGPKQWRQSKARLREWAILREVHRKAAAQRRATHGRLINALLSLGSDFRVETNSYASFRARFGKSLHVAAPGMFVQLLRRKAANAGGQMNELPGWMRYSQTCQCGVVRKKTLSERIHICDCGVGPVQRDLYSAVLMLMSTFDPTRSKWRLDADRVTAIWSSVGSRLPAVSSSLSVEDFVTWAREQAASGDGNIVSPTTGTELLAGEVAAIANEARDVVGERPRARESLQGQRSLEQRLLASMPSGPEVVSEVMSDATVR